MESHEMLTSLRSRIRGMLSTRERMALKYPDGDFTDELKVLNRLLALVDSENPLDMEEVKSLQLYADNYEGSAIWLDIHIVASEMIWMLQQKFDRLDQ
jgi:hypothetical protein